MISNIITINHSLVVGLHCGNVVTFTIGNIMPDYICLSFVLDIGGFGGEKNEGRRMEGRGCTDIDVEVLMKRILMCGCCILVVARAVC